MAARTSDFPFERTLIMGNGGSGKTWLAVRLADAFSLKAVHFDDLHWEPNRYGVARDRALRDADVHAASLEDEWVMEGVYGQLINIVFRRVTTLIWLDLPEAACIKNVKDRGIQGGESEDSFSSLISWIAEYRSRKNNWNSYDAHQKFFEFHSGPKFLLKNRADINEFLQDAID
ncbi:AAA family ATPase [Martelella sp. FOR1707]